MKVLRPEVIEYDNFFRTDSVDANLWTKTITGSGGTRTITYEGGVIQTYSNTGYKSNGNVNLKNKIDLRNFGNKFHFTAFLKCECNRYSSHSASTELKIAGVSIASCSIGSTGANDQGNVFQQCVGVEVWGIIEGNNLNLIIKGLNGGYYSYYGVSGISGTSTIVSTPQNINISAKPVIEIELISGTYTGSNTSARSISWGQLSPIYFTNQIYGSKKEKTTP